MNKNIIYNGNPLLKKGDIPIEYTKEQIEEFIKCKTDPIYFIKNHVYITTLDKGKIKFNLWDFQEEMINTCNDNRFSIFCCARQQGKCVTKDMKITIRNKKTKEIKTINIEDLFLM